jgi:hypothetical protein
MRVFRGVGLGLLACGAVASIAVVASLPTQPPELAPGDPLPDADRRAVGVLHVHSSYSDGSEDVTDIARAAGDAGLDFVVLTDHGDPDALGAEGEEYLEGVLLLVGSEISTEGGHILALEIPDPAFRFGTELGETLRDIDEMGGFAIAAHPHSRRPNFAWTGWDLPGLTGIELFNFFSGWRRQSGWRVGMAALVYPFSPRRALAAGLDWEPLLIEKWDRLLVERDLVAWVALDAHGRVTLAGDVQLPWPSYRAVFEMARNYLVLDGALVGKAEQDRESIYRALERGQGYISLDGLADGSRFVFYAEGDSRRWPLGSHVPLGVPGLRLVASVDAPPGTRLRLLKGGAFQAESADGTVSLDVDEPGAYRVEARLDPRFVPGNREQPWIISNPIFVLLEEEIERRRALLRDFPPLPSADGMTCQAVGDEPWRMAFHPEHDPASRMDEEAAESFRGSFRMDFQLSEPTDERSYVWCAVADRTPRDLTGFDAIRFQVKGEDVYRVSFQLRDARPGSPDEDTEWWASSFKTAPEWREVVIPFGSLRSITETSDGSLDLDGTQGLFFVLDAGNTRPGTSGVIEVRDLEFCSSN